MSSSNIPTPPLIPGDLEVSSLQATRPKIVKDTVTQLVSTATGVTLNASAGIITMFTSTLAADASQEFVVTNSYVSSGVVILASIQDYSGTTGLPNVIVDNIGNGSFNVVLQNCGAAALNGVVKVSFLIV